MTESRRIKWPWMAGAAAVMVAIGYGTASFYQSSADATAPHPIVGQGRMSFPFDAYHLTAQQAAEQANESNVIIRACMKNYGISYLKNTPDITAKVARGFAIADSRRYGISDMDAAQKFGYHLPPAATSTGKLTTEADPHLSGPEMSVLTGVSVGHAQMGKISASSRKVGSYKGKAIPQGGCVGTADRALQEPGSTKALRQANLLAAGLERKAFLKTQTHPRVRIVFHKWSMCMKSRGYSYANPIKAATDRTWDMGKPATRREIAIAVADVKCKQQTDLVNIEYRVESALENSLIRQHKTDLAPLKTAVSAQVSALQDAEAKYGH